MTDWLEADTAAAALGGLVFAVLRCYVSVEYIFYSQQNHTVGMKICLNQNVSLGWICFKACFQGGCCVCSGIFTQVQLGIRDYAGWFCKIIHQFVPFLICGKSLQDVKVMAHIVSDFAGFCNGCTQAAAGKKAKESWWAGNDIIRRRQGRKEASKPPSAESIRGCVSWDAVSWEGRRLEGREWRLEIPMQNK